MKKSHLDQ